MIQFVRSANYTTIKCLLKNHYVAEFAKVMSLGNKCSLLCGNTTMESTQINH